MVLPLFPEESSRVGMSITLWNANMIQGLSKVTPHMSAPERVCSHRARSLRKPRARIMARMSGAWAILGLLVCLCWGCVLSSRPSAVPPGSQAHGYGEVAPPKQEGRLIKPYIPGNAGEAEPARSSDPARVGADPSPSPPEEGASGLPSVSSDSRWPSDQVAQSSGTQDQWELQQVKAAAIKKATGIPTVLKIKVSYAVDSDEWWVILYDDRGPLIDLKQYVWNRETQKLEPFLVLRQIAKSQLERHLTEKLPGRVSHILDYPPAG